MQPSLPLHQAAFATFLASELIREPDIQVVNVQDLKLQLRVRDVQVQVFLDNLYAEYLREPAALASQPERLARQLRSTLAGSSSPRLDEIHTRLLPQIKPQLFFQSLTQQKATPLVRRPFVSDLFVTYTIDEPQSMILVNALHLAEWSMDEEMLYHLAIDNLRQIDMAYSVYGEGERRLYICQMKDGYDATRILLGPLLDEWAGGVRPYRLLLGIPYRDMLIGFPEANASLVADLARQIRRDAAHRSHAISGQLFVWENSCLAPYRPSAP